MLNQVTMEGRLTRDPNIRKTKDGTAVCNFNIACERGYNSEAVDYIDCVLWREEGVEFAKYAEKGRRVIIHGSLHGKSWTTRDGQKRTGYEIAAEEAYFIDGRKQKAREVNATEDGDYPMLSDEETPF